MRGSPERCALRSSSVISDPRRGGDRSGRQQRPHGLVQPHLLLLDHLRQEEPRERLGDGADLEESVGLRGAVGEDAAHAVLDDADRHAGVGGGSEVPAARERRGQVPVEDVLQARHVHRGRGRIERRLRQLDRRGLPREHEGQRRSTLRPAWRSRCFRRPRRRRPGCPVPRAPGPSVTSRRPCTLPHGMPMERWSRLSREQLGVVFVRSSRSWTRRLLPPASSVPRQIPVREGAGVGVAGGGGGAGGGGWVGMAAGGAGGCVTAHEATARERRPSETILRRPMGLATLAPLRGRGRPGATRRPAPAGPVRRRGRRLFG